MNPGGVDQLVSGHGVPELQPRDEPAILQKIKDAIDARARDIALACAQTVFDFKRRQRAGLAREQIDDRVARPSPAMTGLVEHGTRVLGPLRSADC